MILKSNAFRFGNEYYRQITGTTMETPMAPNYRIILTHLQTISSSFISFPSHRIREL